MPKRKSKEVLFRRLEWQTFFSLSLVVLSRSVGCRRLVLLFSQGCRRRLRVKEEEKLGQG